MTQNIQSNQNTNDQNTFNQNDTESSLLLNNNQVIQQETKDNEESSRFKDGQILRMVRVRFPGNARSFSFFLGKRDITYGQKVVAMSDRGIAVGYVNSFPYEVAFDRSMLPIRSINKIATDDDIAHDLENYRKQKQSEKVCQDLIEQYQLEMNLTHVEFTQFGKKAVFYFIAPARIDFRNLVKDLVGALKMRVELRQISVRDRAASLGGLGSCGRQLCCSSFLAEYGNVAVKMAKNQDLTLNFSKLNGVCGQLKCCLQYEDEVYDQKRKKLPRENDIIQTVNGDIGRVTKLHILIEQFEIITNQGVRKRMVFEMFDKKLENYDFPEFFEYTSNETHIILGLEDKQKTKVAEFEKMIESSKERAKSYAAETFENLFGSKSLDYSLPEVEEIKTYQPKAESIDLNDEEAAFSPEASEDEIIEQTQSGDSSQSAHRSKKRRNFRRPPQKR